MLGTKQIADQKPAGYATSGDFCRIFMQDMRPLYLLSFLLTGDQFMAEECFVRGLEDAAKGNPVFKEWAQSWARRIVIQKAIEMVQPRTVDRSLPSSVSKAAGADAAAEPKEIASVVDLPAFERFVFVMSVLERTSDQECSALLDCGRNEVMAARTRALQRMATRIELHSKAAAAGADKTRDAGSALRLENVSHLPVSA